MKRVLWYKAVVRDYKGMILFREEEKSRSFLGLWNKMIWTQMDGASFPGSLMVTDINGSGWALGVGTSGNNFRMNGGAENPNMGIVIGTSDTPVDVSDYRLGGLITQGFGTVQMDYMAMVINPSVEGVRDIRHDGTFPESFHDGLWLRSQGCLHYAPGCP